MATHPIPDLLSMWDKGQLTSDQAIGHLLQTVDLLSQRLADAEQQLRRQAGPHPAASAPAPATRRARARTRAV